MAKAVREKAKREKLSLNKAIVKLLEEATGAAPRGRESSITTSTTSPARGRRQEYQQFMAALREQRQIDPEMWK